MRHRPPLRRCPGCGGDVYAWTEGTACRRCMSETAGDSQALVEMVREGRRRRTGETPATFGHGTLPPDDIPY